jgi:hypothetical protein
VLWSQQKKKALAKLVDLLAELLDFNTGSAQAQRQAFP